jgi:hypothetical protein
MTNQGFDYANKEVKTQSGGKKIVREVLVKNGRGYKSVTLYQNGKKKYTVKKPLHKHHITKIKNGKFVPGLFHDCKKKTCKNKK